MKTLFSTLALTLIFSIGVFAQAQRVTNKTSIGKEVANPVAKQATPQGHYCDYCKNNYEESHFPCIMKSIKGKIDATGHVSFVDGNPIGGIVVKGGKNPGGSLNVVTNSNGEVEINNATAGDYKFVVSLPTNNAQARVSGAPIGGVVVKGGKNPGGQMFTLITNARGEIILNNLEPGNYKFVVMGPTEKERLSPLYNSTTKETYNPGSKIQ